ncbi:hypothetical protein OF83DRAFT_1139912 [Amylostereum chailletii]|nr:hypothetical protein OF83DRAFT_1139912 [Amylostereum chailletii]
MLSFNRQRRISEAVETWRTFSERWDRELKHKVRKDASSVEKISATTPVAQPTKKQTMSTAPAESSASVSQAVVVQASNVLYDSLALTVGRRRDVRRSDTAGSAPSLSEHPSSSSQSTGGHDLSPYTRHPVFWFADGSVIVRCGSTVFKLHKGLLSASSTYFKGKLDLPASKPQLITERGLETCPMLILDTNDSDETCFSDLMALLYRTNDWKTSPPDLHAIGALLHACTSLSFPRIRDQVVAWLEERWPSTLPPLDSPPILHPMQALCCARTHNIPKVLKRAHYELIRSPECASVIEANRAGAKHSELSIAVLWLRTLLADAWAKDMAAPPPDILCTHGAFAPAASPEALSAFWAARVQTSGLYLKYRYDPISGIEAVFERLKLVEEGVCAGCYLKARAWVTSKREAWWKILDDVR